MVKQFLRSRDGATAIEYALIAGILVLAIVAGMAELSRVVGQTYGNVAEDLAEAGN
ncbi:Flp family type IVb pilin [Chelativorans sp. AA-79]|uniref:Flp family type IVb pilin n=1 Tax=Chelativorans sp. AA-79 TaxID=3028735 RepID=UPI0023F9B0D9|nr:Flp family type IVb pilin [Chelativorans sp. AA-79]WEX09014.1 Flp family type IVb pilin [Chelativorans sp. AA-79]